MKTTEEILEWIERYLVYLQAYPASGYITGKEEALEDFKIFILSDQKASGE